MGIIADILINAFDPTSTIGSILDYANWAYQTGGIELVMRDVPGIIQASFEADGIAAFSS